MPPNKTCTNSGCPNRGILTLDANSLFFLIEGTIRYVQGQYPGLTTNASRLPRILEELDSYLRTIEGCCSLDGALHVSDLVFYEEVLEVDRKELIELKKYNSAQRGQILQVLREHFPQPRVVSQQEIQSLCALFPNPEICPHDKDASLIVVACDLATSGQPTIVLTSDPDFIAPIRWLMQQGVVTLGTEHTFPTNQIMDRHYFHFVRCLHDCCNLPTARYEALGNTYIAAQLQRLPNLKKNVMRRVISEVQEVQAIHVKAVQYKCTIA